MTDLTKITTPFGLLDAEAQEALRAHGGPYEWYHSAKRGWLDDPSPEYTFDEGNLTIRVKPQPPKPREWWIITEDKTGRRWVHDTLVDLTRADVSAVHVREVLSDD